MENFEKVFAFTKIANRNKPTILHKLIEDAKQFHSLLKQLGIIDSSKGPEEHGR